MTILASPTPHPVILEAVNTFRGEGLAWDRVIEGVEKAWISLLIPKHQRGVSFGGLALVSAGAGLLGNGACGWWLAQHGTTVFLVLAASAIIGAGLTWMVRPMSASSAA